MSSQITTDASLDVRYFLDFYPIWEEIISEWEKPPLSKEKTSLNDAIASQKYSELLERIKNVKKTAGEYFKLKNNQSHLPVIKLKKLEVLKNASLLLQAIEEIKKIRPSF